MSVGSVKLSDQPMPRSSMVSLKNVVYSCGVSKHMISLGLSVKYVSEALRVKGVRDAYWVTVPTPRGSQLTMS